MRKELLRRKYSLRTIQTYLECVNNFLNYSKKEERKISKKDVKDYLDFLVSKNKSGSTINVNLNALKFLIEEILNKNFMVKIRFSKTPKSLPIFLSQEEVTHLINNIENRKHKLMIKLLYSSGLRVSELINLRISDLEIPKDYGWVRHGKGDKDRMFIIAETLRGELLDYIKNENLNSDSYLFQSYNGRMSVRTVQEILKKATKKSKINKNVHPHTLRHSYATHLIENGYDVASVQSLLGHNSSQTTMIYLHIAPKKFINVKSPIDNLQFNNDYEKLNYESKNIDDKSVKGEKFN